MVVTHNGYTVPYQLHCCTQLALLTEEELTDDGVADLDDEDTDEGTDDGVEDLDEGTDEGVEEPPPPQTAPLTVGRSSAPPFLSN